MTSKIDTRWDIFFLQTALLTSKLSKDPSTKVGAVITKDQEIISSGYNGFPRKMPDLLAWYNAREVKLLYTEHAEINAILSAGRSGRSVVDCTIYSTHFSCIDCCKHTIQAGIKKFVYIENPEFESRWNSEPVKKMFELCNVEMVPVELEYFNDLVEHRGFKL
jgi:dCMP deaminase